jgi:alpha-amylase
MQKRYCIIGTYNHVPEGAEESSFEETYQVCWRPYLSALYRFPDIYSVLHYSGSALVWLEARHPEFLMLLEEMAARKQIELLGGGFFSPLLPLVPAQDRLGQVEMLTTYIRKAFGKRPRGCWIQDYAWEPGLASSLQTSGFEYTFLPERFFRLAGADPGSPALTEDQGRSLFVFPVFDGLENFPRLLPIHEAIGQLRENGSDYPLMTVLFPGEAAKAMWESSGLESPDVLFEQSFAALQKDSLVCETTTPARFMKNLHRAERAYFASGSSSTLQRRSLPPRVSAGTETAAELYGSTRRLLLSHGESTALYAKMQYVRILVGQLRGDKSRKKSAQEELWRGQCGDAYWPALNGGIQRLSIRAAAYAALIEAEKTTRQRGAFAPGVIMADIDFDGEREILYQGSDFNAYVHLRGGSLFELDSLKTLTNYANAFSGAVEETGGWRPRRCFLDSFSEAGSFGPEIGNHREGLYQLEESDRPAHLAVLTREGFVDLGGRKRSVAIRKKFAFRKVALSVIYELSNREDEALSLRFRTELNLAAGANPAAVFIEGHGAGGEKMSVSSSGNEEQAGLDFLRITNTKAEEHIELRSDHPFALASSPIILEEGETGTSEAMYEGSSFLLGWDLVIPAGSSVKIAVALEIRS